MSEDYHELVNCYDVLDVEEFEIERARNLVDAAERCRDYTVVRLLKRFVNNFECIIVDVETDGVPPKNSCGIRYKERLAMCVSSEPKQLVDVLALRKDFPSLMHQNLTPRDEPKNLCLYFEPASAVLRTWTPQKFLRRIQWWLEKSAKEELHPADQPVEQLFFQGKYELVLPWNFQELSRSGDHQLVIVLRSERSDEGKTLFAEFVHKSDQPSKGAAQCFEFTLPSIEHGLVESTPTTLGELSDILESRGVEILPVLKKALQALVGPQCAREAADVPLTIFLIHIPLVRKEGDGPERFSSKAFMVLLTPLQLGIAVGAIFSAPTDVGENSTKNFYSSEYLLNAEPVTEWRDKSLLPMEVLKKIDPFSARKQSGITETGPVGVLIGVGSLGSALLNLWGRSGWGQWTVVDKDYIKPHNLVRHTAYANQIGQPKVNVAVQLHNAVMEDASEVIPLHADACDFSRTEITDAVSCAGLVIDASTTLEYPRASSAVDRVGRHFSVFITPSGEAAVLLAEDTQRQIRLRSLESQYYRALIKEEWGKHHLDGNLGSFWSGASCRDISLVIPYSRVINHAATLAEQIQIEATSPNARIRVWQRDPTCGSVVVHEVPINRENCFEFGEIMVYLDEGLIKSLRELRSKSLPSETGGVLLGYYDFNISAVMIVGTLPAPLDSGSSPKYFERGIEGLTEAVSEVSRRTAGIVGYIGEWHSHPKGHSALPSDEDLIQLCHLSRQMAEDGLSAVQLIVGEGDIQILKMSEGK